MFMTHKYSLLFALTLQSHRERQTPSVFEEFLESYSYLETF